MFNYFPLFQDRRDAGRRLAARLTSLSLHDPLVLALPRGGVPIGYEVARALDADLDVLIVRKLGVPGRDELAMGAIASGGVRVLNHDLITALGIGDAMISEVVAREQNELERRERAFRGDRPLLPIRGRDVVIVDDGLATGATMRAAATSVRTRGPTRLIAAVPVGAPASCRELAARVDELVCLEQPEHLDGVGKWYRDFRQTSDEEVRELLAARPQEARRAHA